MTEVVQELVVGVDGSEASEHALRVALHEAATTHEAVRVLHTWTVPVTGSMTAYTMDFPGLQSPLRQETAAGFLDDIVRAAQHDVGDLDVQLVQDVHAGDAGTELLRAAEHADLLVIGTRQHGGLLSAVLGSATNYVLHHATCPVMVVPASTAPVTSWAKVVVGVDGSEVGDAALRWGAHRARAHGCPLLAVHTWQLITNPDWYGVPTTSASSYANQVESWLRDHVDTVLAEGRDGLSVEVRAVQDQAASGLLGSTAADELLVVGSRGRGGFTDLVLGSVAMQCAHHARSAVTVVRPAKGATR
jgi:nucleotide-binding universal stress UspA family protein